MRVSAPLLFDESVLTEVGARRRIHLPRDSEQTIWHRLDSTLTSQTDRGSVKSLGSSRKHGFRYSVRPPGDGAGFALVKITADDIDEILDAIEIHETIEEVSVMALSDGVATVQVEAHAPLLMAAARQAGIPIEMPVEIENGWLESTSPAPTSASLTSGRCSRCRCGVRRRVRSTAAEPG